MSDIATEMSWEDIKTLIAQLAIQSKETDRRMQETDRMIRELQESSKETDRRIQETDRMIRELQESSKETDRRIQETDRMIRELQESSKETDRRIQETDRMIRELRESNKETDRLIRELQESTKETDRLIRELRESSKETDRRMQETDRRMQETDRRMQETDRKLREVSRQIGQLGNRLGQFVEDMVEPAVVRLFRARNIPVHRVYPKATARDDDGKVIMEIDLLVINGDHAIAVECKSRLSTSDVDEHVERLVRFKSCFPEHADKILLGAVAAMGAPEQVVRYAERQGLYVLVQADDDIVLCNQPDFAPKQW